jgi:4'-phosphopantetheinyl transferase
MRLRHFFDPPGWSEAMDRLPHVDMIDVWTTVLRASTGDIERFSALLSADERDRQARMLAGVVRDRFTIARATLRLLAARYLGIHPGAIKFSYGPRGKPDLAGTNEGLRFNLAHSEDVAVYAFTRGHEIGVDVERVREIPDMDRIAHRFFALDECMVLDSLPSQDRAHAFYLAWTRKEAYVKAVGDGLHIPLDSFSVTLRPGEQARLIGFDKGPRFACDWNLHSFENEPGFVGAVAYRGSRKQLKICRFRDPVFSSPGRPN